MIWALRGPLGAFIAAWGGLCMLTSAPFDNWWHDSFGLDVMILSPPHVVLLVGMFVMGLGGLVLTTSQMNLSSGERRDKLSWLLLYNVSLLLSLLFMLGLEYIGDQTLCRKGVCKWPFHRGEIPKLIPGESMTLPVFAVPGEVVKRPWVLHRERT